MTVAWLGQAGFDFTAGDFRFLVDPYLSDSLAEKYRGTRFPHVRMMVPPAAPEDLGRVDLVCCTHRHTDHMDPGTLPVIADRNPACRFVVPAATADHAVETAGLERTRLLPVDDGDRVEAHDTLSVSAIASAHEEIALNEKGESAYLGYVFETGGVTVYHAGDCVPCAGLDRRLAGCSIDVAILPVNGRDAYRREHGVPGNFTIDEAIDLCRQAGIPVLVPCHFGMFAFNTADPEELRRRAAAERDITITVPRIGEEYRIVGPAG